MGYQSIFQRYELKYLISRDKKDLISEIIAERAVADEYGASTVEASTLRKATRDLRHSTLKLQAATSE